MSEFENKNETENTPDYSNDVTNSEPADSTAHENAPAETEADASAQIIAQLQAQNAALMEQNANLNDQVVRMIRGGAQLTGNPPEPSATPPDEHDGPLDDLPSIEDMARDIGIDRPKVV